ncbi:MAG: helix-turn-helix domain-containing protein, partial [Candidatus Moraniibacteriota bacterium]
QIFGLNEKEAEIYMATLELGEATGFQIYKKTSLKKPTVYYILDELQKRGLVVLTKKGKKKYYIAESPTKIQEDLENKLKSFNSILPQLLSVYNIQAVKPKLRYYEGKDGIKEVYADTLKYKDEILSFSSENVVSILGEDFSLDYIRKRVKKNIPIKSIVPNLENIQEKFLNKNQEQLRSAKLIDPKEFNFPIEINIYANKVAFMSFRDELAVIIESDEINKMMKLLFSFFWNKL